MPYIQEYLHAVQDRLKSMPKRMTANRQKQHGIIEIGPDYYQHAVTAFVAMKETPMLEPIEPEDITPPSHGIISTLLQQLHSRKSDQQHKKLRNDNNSNVAQHPPTKETPTFDPSSANKMDMCVELKFDAGLMTPSTPNQHDSKKSLRQITPKRKRSLKQRERRAERAKVKRKRESKHKSWKQSQ